MRLWLSRSSEVPLREQLVTQIRLGIISGDLKVRQKLPSTRELARRFQIHSNTVSAAYRELHRSGWVEFRKGSGVYVRKLDAEAKLEGSLKLDQLAAQFFKAAREGGFSLGEIKSSLAHWLNVQPPDHLLVIEPDIELRRILIAEIEAATRARVRGASIDECRDASRLIGAAPVAMYGQAEAVQRVLPPGIECLLLHSTSVVESLKGEQRPAADALIAVASRWPRFLESSRAILVAAGLDPNALSFRDARERGWKRGLASAAFVVTDSLMVRDLPSGCEARVFNILSDSSIGEVKQFAKQLIRR